MGHAELGLLLHVRSDLLGAAGKGRALPVGTGHGLAACPGDAAEPDGYRARIAAGRCGPPVQAVHGPLELLGCIQRKLRVARAGRPTVTERRGAADSRRTLAADPEWRMGSLHRLGREFNVGELQVLPLELRVLLIPERDEGAQVLVGDGTALVERGRHHQRTGLLAVPAYTEQDVQPAVGEHVNRGQHLRGEQGIAVRHDHEGHQPYPGGLAGQKTDDGQDFERVLGGANTGDCPAAARILRLDDPRHDESFGRSHAVEAQRIGLAGDSPHTHRVVMRATDVDAYGELHGALPPSLQLCGRIYFPASRATTGANSSIQGCFTK